jgi:hypothetical protein
MKMQLKESSKLTDSKETKVQPREVQNFIESQVSAPLAE